MNIATARAIGHELIDFHEIEGASYPCGWPDDGRLYAVRKCCGQPQASSVGGIDLGDHLPAASLLEQAFDGPGGLDRWESVSIGGIDPRPAFEPGRAEFGRRVCLGAQRQHL